MLTELEHGATAVITRHGVMHSFPEPLDDVDPGMIDGLEEQLELSICTQPPLDELALVDFVVVEDEYHLVGTPILPAKEAPIAELTAAISSSAWKDVTFK